MRSILFHIPPEFWGWPTFGLGWALLAWALGSGAYLAFLLARPERRTEIAGLLPMLAVLGLAIFFLLPRMEDVDPLSGEKLGVPIRGYGLMLLVAITAGVAAAVRRARQSGLDPELILSLAVYMFLAGIFGARAFFVLQNWGEFATASPLETLKNIVNITNGGLVVYGAFLAAVPVAVWFMRSRRMPLLLTADVASAAMLIGLALGRLGCLLHGCCFGGVCDLPWGVTFPAGSPPYDYQVSLGVMHGFRLERNEAGEARVAWVDEAGPAAAAGLQPGDILQNLNGAPLPNSSAARAALRGAGRNLLVTTSDGRRLAWQAAQFPPRTPLRMHPAQVYASLSAAVLALVLWFFFPFRRHTGEVFGLLLTLYPVVRFLEEVIRDDEGTFVAGLTVSQAISVGLFACGLSLLVWLQRQPASR